MKLDALLVTGAGGVFEKEGALGPRLKDAGVSVVDLPRIWAFRMRVSISPRGSFISYPPYQLDLTRPGIWPIEPRSRSAIRLTFSFR